MNDNNSSENKSAKSDTIVKTNDDLSPESSSSKYVSPQTSSVKLTPFGKNETVSVNQFKTPQQTYYNPFDRCVDLLKCSTVSPSLFKEVVSPSIKDEVDFKWAIEQIAVLYPASIPTSPFNQIESTADKEYETAAQEAINKFFSNNVVPSPWTGQSSHNSLNIPTSLASLYTPVMKKVSLKEESCIKNYIHQPNNSEKNCVWTQTELTFPMDLPKEIEDLLAPFCTFNQVQCNKSEENDETVNLNNTTLRRKLLFSNENSDTPKNSPTKADHNDSIEVMKDLSFSSPIITGINSNEEEVITIPWGASMIRSSQPDSGDSSNKLQNNCYMSPNIESIRFDSSVLELSPIVSLANSASKERKLGTFESPMAEVFQQRNNEQKSHSVNFTTTPKSNLSCVIKFHSDRKTNQLKSWNFSPKLHYSRNVLRGQVSRKEENKENEECGDSNFIKSLDVSTYISGTETPNSKLNNSSPHSAQFSSSPIYDKRCHTFDMQTDEDKIVSPFSATNIHQRLSDSPPISPIKYSYEPLQCPSFSNEEEKSANAQSKTLDNMFANLDKKHFIACDTTEDTGYQTNMCLTQTSLQLSPPARKPKLND